MESFLNRYRNITVLLLVIFAQLVLLAVQVKNDQDVRMIRVWTVSAVTPVARVMEWFRGGSIGFVRNYILMHDASEDNRRLRDELGRLRLENNFPARTSWPPRSAPKPCRCSRRGRPRRCWRRA